MLGLLKRLKHIFICKEDILYKPIYLDRPIDLLTELAITFKYFKDLIKAVKQIV